MKTLAKIIGIGTLFLLVGSATSTNVSAKQKTATVTVRCVDKTNKKAIAKPYKIKVKVGKKTTVKEKKFNNYFTPKKITKTFKHNATVTYQYTPKKVHVTVKYVDAKTKKQLIKPVTHTVKYNNRFTAEDKLIKGHLNPTAITKTITKNTTITYYYWPNPYFDPKDVSDYSIWSIATCEDAYRMYYLVVADYLGYYETNLKGTSAWNETTYKNLTKTWLNKVNTVSDLYFNHGNFYLSFQEKWYACPYLINLRDNLHTEVDNVVKNIQK